MPVLTPAYGRDYKSAAEAEKAYLEGKDWILNDISSRWDGKPCSCRDFPNQRVELRYAKLRKATVATYTGEKVPASGFISHTPKLTIDAVLKHKESK